MFMWYSSPLRAEISTPSRTTASPFRCNRSQGNFVAYTHLVLWPRKLLQAKIALGERVIVLTCAILGYLDDWPMHRYISERIVRVKHDHRHIGMSVYGAMLGAVRNRVYINIAIFIVEPYWRHTRGTIARCRTEDHQEWSLK